MLCPAYLEKEPMPSDKEPESITINADGLAALLAAMTIEIVAALHPPKRSAEQSLTDIANGLLDHAGGLRNASDAALVRMLARNLIATENSGLGPQRA